MSKTLIAGKLQICYAYFWDWDFDFEEVLLSLTVTPLTLSSIPSLTKVFKNIPDGHCP